MLDLPVAAFDIETIPDPDIGRRLLAIEGDDATVIREMARRRLEESGGKTDYPQSPWHRVVSVCVTTLDPESGHVEIRALGGAPFDERSHVEGFFRFIEEATPPRSSSQGPANENADAVSDAQSPNAREGVRLVSWNGGGFDLPVLRYRAMMLGVAAPAFYRDDEQRRLNNYQNRYHDLHVDLMDVLSGYGASSRVGLGTLGQLLRLPGKTFLDRPVYDHVLDGEDVRVAEYCKLDTVQTLLLYLVWAFHCGRLTRENMRRYVGAVREAIGGLSFEAWRDVEATLERWPTWAWDDA